MQIQDHQVKRMFAYGTLSSLDTIERYWGWVLDFFNKSKVLPESTIEGILYQESYPCAKDGKGTIYGTLYDFTNMEQEEWDRLVKSVDAIEGNGSLYTRKVVPVTTKDGITKAWVYFYNYECNPANQVKSGKWEDWKY